MQKYDPENRRHPEWSLSRVHAMGVLAGPAYCELSVMSRRRLNAVTIRPWGLLCVILFDARRSATLTTPFFVGWSLTLLASGVAHA
jgi:hypothetical protein